MPDFEDDMIVLKPTQRFGSTTKQEEERKLALKNKYLGELQDQIHQNVQRKARELELKRLEQDEDDIRVLNERYIIDRQQAEQERIKNQVQRQEQMQKLVEMDYIERKNLEDYERKVKKHNQIISAKQQLEMQRNNREVDNYYFPVDRYASYDPYLV